MTGNQDDSSSAESDTPRVRSDGGNRRRGQQGGQRGGQPQGGQPPQRGQPRGGQPPQGGRPPQGGGRGRRQPPGDDDSRFTRRQLLVGGGAAVAAGAGGWFFFLRGPTGAKGVADDYINAVSTNDWSAAGELFHSDSSVSQTISESDNISDYKQFIDENGQLSRLENIEPSVKNHIEFSHYPNYNESTAEDVGGFRGPNPENAGNVDEAKLISSVLEVDISAWYESEGEENPRADDLAGDTTNVGISVATVLNGEDWSIWSVGGF